MNLDLQANKPTNCAYGLTVKPSIFRSSFESRSYRGGVQCIGVINSIN